jgi:cyclase
VNLAVGLSGQRDGLRFAGSHRRLDRRLRTGRTDPCAQVHVLPPPHHDGHTQDLIIYVAGIVSSLVGGRADNAVLRVSNHADTWLASGIHAVAQLIDKEWGVVQDPSGGRLMAKTLVLIIAVLTLGALPLAQAPPAFEIPVVRGNGLPPPSWTPGAVTVTPDNLEVLPVQGQVYLVAGAGGNIVVQAGTDGLLVVDTGHVETSEQVLALIEQHFRSVIRFVINTSADPDHIGGNALIAGAGVAQSSRSGGGGRLGGSPAGAQIYAHEAVLNWLSAPTGQQAALPFEFWPTDTYFTDEKQLFFNGEAIQILHQPAAHTDGDSVVFFRRSDVVAAGDVYTSFGYPVFDPARGGSYQGSINALNRLLELAIPDFHAEGGTYIVPGHGHISDEVDVAEYRNMATIIRDRVQDALDRGLSLEETKASRPTLDYDGRYVETAGAWTTERFVDAVYHDLTAAAR